MWSILDNVPYELVKNVYSSMLEWKVQYLPIRSLWSMYWSSPLFTDFLSECSIHYWKWGIEISYYCIAVYFSFQSCQFIFIYLGAWCYNCYIFLLNWPFYRYEILCIALITLLSILFFYLVWKLLCVRVFSPFIFNFFTDTVGFRSTLLLFIFNLPHLLCILNLLTSIWS